MVHACPRCGYYNTHKNNMRKHYDRKSPCVDKNGCSKSIKDCKKMLDEK